MIDGYNLRAEMEHQRLAWHASNIMNVHLKKRVTPAQLLGKEKVNVPQSEEDKHEEFEKLMELRKKQRSR